VQTTGLIWSCGRRDDDDRDVIGNGGGFKQRLGMEWTHRHSETPPSALTDGPTPKRGNVIDFGEPGCLTQLADVGVDVVRSRQPTARATTCRWMGWMDARPDGMERSEMREQR
jgi:hypothetical protein